MTVDISSQLDTLVNALDQVSASFKGDQQIRPVAQVFLAAPN